MPEPAFGALSTDFRSDTITQPSPAMYSAIADAPLGDDVFGDDITTNALEMQAAQLLGKEAALFLPTGTMANSVAIAVATRPGDEILALDDSHVFLNEQAGAARLWGVQTRTLNGVAGCPEPPAILAAIRPNDIHAPRTSLLCLENTHNFQGGRVIAPSRLAAIHELCQVRALHLHLDGARLFNACVAAGVGPTTFTSHCESVMVSLSKGLRCPAGALLAGTANFIKEARRVRKVLGGGMRQTGILASCGRVALSTGIESLAEDHLRARELAVGLSPIAGLAVKPDPPETNILLVDLAPELALKQGALLAHLEEHEVRAIALRVGRLRLVTHAHITPDGVARTVAAFRSYRGVRSS
ncbi:MAG: threonine aldolase family protein [Planctomycetota bacterium]